MGAPSLVLDARREYGGWLIVGVVFLSAGVTIGSSVYSFGLFIEPLRDSFGWQRTAITASLSIMAVSSIAAPLIGWLMDRYGARPVMTISLAVFGLSFLLRPLMTQLWHLYALSLLQFVCFSGTSPLPAGRLVGIWFWNARGRIMGITLMGNNFGGLVLPLIVGFVLALASWEAAYVVIGAMAMVLALVTLLVVHEHNPHTRAGHDRPRRTTSDRPETADAALMGWTVREALRTWSFYAITLSIMLASFTHTVVLPQVGDHLSNEGMPTTIVPFAISLLATFGMLGKLGFGLLAERITARRAMMASLSGQFVFILLMVAYPTPPLVWASLPLYGLFMAAYGTLVTLIIQENFGLSSFGSILGLISLGSVLPSVAGPLMAGASFDITGSYDTAFLITAVTLAMGVVMLMYVRQPRRKAQISSGGHRIDSSRSGVRRQSE